MTRAPHRGNVAAFLAILREDYPAAFARIGAAPASTELCGCGANAVVTVSDGDGGRDALCYRHAAEELESVQRLMVSP